MKIKENQLGELRNWEFGDWRSVAEKLESFKAIKIGRLNRLIAIRGEELGLESPVLLEKTEEGFRTKSLKKFETGYRPVGSSKIDFDAFNKLEVY